MSSAAMADALNRQLPGRDRSMLCVTSIPSFKCCMRIYIFVLLHSAHHHARPFHLQVWRDIAARICDELRQLEARSPPNRDQLGHAAARQQQRQKPDTALPGQDIG